MNIFAQEFTSDCDDLIRMKVKSVKKIFYIKKSNMKSEENYFQSNRSFPEAHQYPDT